MARRNRLQLVHSNASRNADDDMKVRGASRDQQRDQQRGKEFMNQGRKDSRDQRYVRNIHAKSAGQASVIESIETGTMTAIIGPAGSGKTWLAVATGVEALLAGKVERIVLARPIVEAGEKLGFLPGDLMDKVSPYMRPLYDVLLERMSCQQLSARFDDGSIEVVPLGYMRGRTLSKSFIIVDEAQNANWAQLKMAVTRLGFGSHMVITGDPTQIDLPNVNDSGLQAMVNLLDGRLPGFAAVYLCESDVVRHPMVRAMIPLLAEFPVRS